MKRAALAIGLMCIAVPASAQVTTCVQNGVVTTCRPSGGIDWALLNQPAPTESPMDAFYRGQAMAAERQRRQAAAEAAQQEYARQQYEASRQRDADSRGQQAGALIAQGRCADAEKMALEAGDFTLVNNVRLVCPKP